MGKNTAVCDLNRAAVGFVAAADTRAVSARGGYDDALVDFYVLAFSAVAAADTCSLGSYPTVLRVSCFTCGFNVAVLDDNGFGVAVLAAADARAVIRLSDNCCVFDCDVAASSVLTAAYARAVICLCGNFAAEDIDGTACGILASAYT